MPEPSELAVISDDRGYRAIVVKPDFGRRHYATVYAMLQSTPGPKLLDVSAALMISSDLFGGLAESWKANRGQVPRLAIVMAFHHWAVFRSVAEPALARLASRGVTVRVFYEEQARGTHLAAWFSGASMGHNVAAVVESLRTRWQPSAAWPLVLAALSALLHENARGEDAPELFTEAARISLACGGTQQAIVFAREALRRLGGPPSLTRCKALRALGVALVSQGQATEGLLILDDAIAMAATVGAPVEGARALAQAGLHALAHEDFRGAEDRFRSGIMLLTPDQPDLLATLHHNLALALVHLGHGDAARHVAKALALRTDKHSLGAQQDRELLARIRDGRACPN